MNGMIDRNPRVSIIIPVFDQADLTRQCLASLRQHTPAGECEVIVVDNGSRDETPGLLREWSAGSDDHRVVTNRENLGFARACNQGAAAAKGEYLLFLNNDTEVTPRWLEPLTRTLDLDRRVGAVGSRLLFPDGTIQHAGVAITLAETPHGPVLGGRHLCYRKPADFHGASKPQILRCLTAACLLVRREAFAQVGGFDEDYWNGNEDVDLCLKLGEAGWQLVYRPESVVVHHESQSGEERWSRCDENVARLNERWRDRITPDYYVSEGSIQPAPDFSLRAYVSPRLTCPVCTDEPVRASVVVLTHNALDYTRRCADALLRFTSPRDEILFVDNGSDDGTVEFLRELAAEDGRCKVILNGENLGFAAGNNRGLAAARGEYLVLLNSDVVVTDGWLDRLIAAAENNPQAGIVGPVTNRIAGAQRLQQVEYNEETLAGLGEFAATVSRRHAGEDHVALWVVGFCMLIKREVLERLGGLDERFGRGNFEDNDYCLRAFLAGYQNLIATDCFVHHFGSRSFAAARVDYQQSLERNWELFKEKWHIPQEIPYGGKIDLDPILLRGFDPVLHFEPLPDGSVLSRVPPADWEREQWLSRGEEYYQQGWFRDAERLFREALAWAPADSRAANDLACALWEQGRAGEAVALLEAALSRDHDDVDVLHNLEQMRAAMPAPAAAPDTVTVAPPPA